MSAGNSLPYEVLNCKGKHFIRILKKGWIILLANALTLNGGKILVDINLLKAPDSGLVFEDMHASGLLPVEESQSGWRGSWEMDRTKQRLQSLFLY